MVALYPSRQILTREDLPGSVKRTARRRCEQSPSLIDQCISRREPNPRVLNKVDLIGHNGPPEGAVPDQVSGVLRGVRSNGQCLDLRVPGFERIEFGNFSDARAAIYPEEIDQRKPALKHPAGEGGTVKRHAAKGRHGLARVQFGRLSRRGLLRIGYISQRKNGSSDMDRLIDVKQTSFVDLSKERCPGYARTIGAAKDQAQRGW